MSQESENFPVFSIACIIAIRIGRKSRVKKFKILISTVALLATLILPAQAGNPNCAEVDGDYIVSFPRGISIANEMRSATGKSLDTKFTYESVLNGFAATLTAEQACAFKRRPGAVVELDGQAQVTAPKSWGLDRIDEKSVPLDGGTFNVTSNGSGVTIYIVDTGIRSTHQEFTGRIKAGFSAFVKKKVYSLADTEDQNGHGTHVAGIAGGSTLGVAPQATLIPIRVLDRNGSGRWSGIISGLDWIARNNNGKKAVANMSLGGGANLSVDSAVQNLISAGVTVVVAAGNSSTNACNSSPARAVNAITVGASDISLDGQSEGIASYSNIGACVDIYAPGSGILSAYYSSDSSEILLSGTSMASPHVTGIAARYIGSSGNSIPTIVASALLSAKQPLGQTKEFIACLTGTNECN